MGLNTFVKQILKSKKVKKNIYIYIKGENIRSGLA